MWWDHAKLGLPVIGDIILRATLARFARSFAIVSRSGVPTPQGLTATARTVGNEYVAARVVAMREGVERGDSLTRTAAAMGVFTPLVLQMLTVGEETGRVGDMLQEVAEYYESEVDYDVRRLSDLIQPLLIAGVGVIVTVLALGVFLPMWDLTQLTHR
jgi:MSHA biogenesis protein MshG